MISPGIYYSIFIVSLLVFTGISKLYKDLETVCKTFVWLTMTLFTGLRVAVGPDYVSYFDSYTNTTSSPLFSRIEPFWQMVILFCNDVGVPFHLWLTIIAGLTYYIFFKALKSWRVDWVLGVLAYLLVYQGFFESTNQIRQCLAIPFVLWGLSFLYQRRYMPFILLIVLGSVFHLSALVCLLMFPLINLPWKRYVLMTFLVVSFLLGMLFFKDIINSLSIFIPSSYQVYLEQLNVWSPKASTGLYRIFLNLVTLILIVLIYKSQVDDRRLNFLIRMGVFSVCIYNVFFSFAPAMRLMIYPFMSFIILFAITINNTDYLRIRNFTRIALLGFALFTIKDVANPRLPLSHYQTIIGSTQLDFLDKIKVSDRIKSLPKK